jgi:Arc/MetJ-type ribon-helix-helix transcriptional regulator
VSRAGRDTTEPEGQQPGDDGATADSRRELSALEGALRRALATASREEVVKSIAATMPIEIAVAQSARLHGGKVRKVSVSMPEELAEAVRARTGAGGFSRYVTDAVQEQVRLDLLDDLAAELEAEYGPVDEDQVERAMREWPDYKQK